MTTHEIQPDGAIVERLQRRDPAAMADLYDRYGRLVYSLVFRIVARNGEAEEVVQEIFLRVWTRAHLIDCSKGGLAPWLLTVARHLAVDHLKASHTRVARLEVDTMRDFLSPSKGFEFSPDLAVRFRDVQQVFGKLTVDQRRVLELAYFEGMSQSEIADFVGRPLGTVKTWIRSALQMLRTHIESAQSRPAVPAWLAMT